MDSTDVININVQQITWIIQKRCEVRVSL